MGKFCLAIVFTGGNVGIINSKFLNINLSLKDKSLSAKLFFRKPNITLRIQVTIITQHQVFFECLAGIGKCRAQHLLILLPNKTKSLFVISNERS